mmetsp:Transcript_4650/g.17491  ORF Transcript_4650/g.17491 Transcript_4650/m.17491 type:complete len:354 (+) Transcript_4650:152-1213(+)
MRLEHFVVCSLNTIAQHGAASLPDSEPPPNKCLAQKLIAAGDVVVNGDVVREPGWQVFLGNGVVCDRVEIRGEAVPVAQAHRLFVLHKPAGVLGVLDRQTRTCFCPGDEAAHLADLVPDQYWSNDLSMYGRLDKPTTGLCILGRRECAGIGSLLLHPSHHVHKDYLVDLAHNNPLCNGGGDGLSANACFRIEGGVNLADGTACEPATLQVLPALGRCTCAERLGAFQLLSVIEQAAHTLAARGSAAEQSRPGPRLEDSCPAYTPVRLTIREGKFHQVKRMLAQVGGYGVHRLHRESFGALSLESMDLPVGAMRPMTEAEYMLVQTMLPPSRMCPEREHSGRWRGGGARPDDES